jgi:signal transduction histidine kinase
VTEAIATSSTREIEIAIRQIGLGTYDLDRVSFVAADEAELVAEVRAAQEEFRLAMVAILDLVQRGALPQARERYIARAKPLADRLDRRTDQLVRKAEFEILERTETSRSAYEASVRVIGGIALASVIVAVASAAALSLAIIRPVRRMDEVLRFIGVGDFTRKVTVENRDELGMLARAINTMGDELAHLYAQIHDASRRKSEFLANMSHELRTPLNAVIGFSEVLRARMFGELNEKQDEYIRDIETSGKHLLALVNDILDLSKVEAGKMELQSSTVSLSEVVESGAMMVRDRAARRGISFTVEIDPALEPLTADERKVKQVLFNLLSNAVKFTPEGGTIEVRAHRLDGEARVAVRDTGPGIAPEDQARIFEEFQQTKVGMQSEESTGLGLTLAKRFIELHGGRLWVESEVGRGSTFTFALPYAPAAQA